MNKAAKVTLARSLAAIESLFETPASFRAWLGAQEPDATAGYALKGVLCPLARWLMGKTGAYLEVGMSLICLGSREIPQSVWMIRFVSEIDTRFKDKVTAREALEVLDVVEAVLAAEQILSTARYRPTEAIMCR